MDPNFPQHLDIQPYDNQGHSNAYLYFDPTGAFDATAQAAAIKRYGIAGRVWEAAHVLLRYLGEQSSSNPDSPFHLGDEAIVILELGSGTGVVGIGLAEILSRRALENAHIILTDLPAVCPLLEANLGLHPGLKPYVSVAPLPWGSLQHVTDLSRILGGRLLTHIICSDLIYFPELLAPLLRSLIQLTSAPASPHIIISYKIRSLLKETPFWSAFGLWFTFQPVLSPSESGWRWFGADADTFVFYARRKEESHGWTVPDEDEDLLDGVGARGTSGRKTDETFELLLLMGLVDSDAA